MRSSTKSPKVNSWQRASEPAVTSPRTLATSQRREGNSDVTATTVYRVANGQLSEHWGETDSLTLMQQLGVLPAPAAQD